MHLPQYYQVNPIFSISSMILNPLPVKQKSLLKFLVLVFPWNLLFHEMKLVKCSEKKTPPLQTHVANPVKYTDKNWSLIYWK